MHVELRAGLAIYNAGEYHAAHDAWEDRWLDLESGSEDERFLHGLIQFTAALHHARTANWAGLSGLVASAREYLSGLPDDHRGVDLRVVRSYLDALHRDPEHVERVAPPSLAHEGDPVTLDDLDFEAAAVAARVLAEERAALDESTVERAVDYARADLAAGDETSPLVTLVLDLVRRPDERGLVHQRLSEHVARRDHERQDVDGLFD
jgi:predicted metal-dependent hydrolase